METCVLKLQMQTLWRKYSSIMVWLGTKISSYSGKRSDTNYVSSKALRWAIFAHVADCSFFVISAEGISRMVLK